MAIILDGINYSADEARPGGWLGEDTAVVDWDLSLPMLVGIRIGSTTHNGDTVTPEIRWRVNAGAWTVLGATGSCKYISTTELTDENDVVTGDMGSTGETSVTGVTCEQENSGIATNSTTLAKNEATELHVGVSFEDASDGDEFEFALYESGGQIDIAAASVTVALVGATFEESVTLTSVAAVADVGVKDAEGVATLTSNAQAGFAAIATMVGIAALAAVAVITPAFDAFISEAATTLSAVATDTYLDEVPAGDIFEEEVTLTANAALATGNDEVFDVDTGGGGDYLSANAFQSGEAGNLITGMGSKTARTRASVSGADTAQCDLTGWTVNDYQTLSIVQAESDRHAGVWSDSIYRIGNDAQGNVVVLRISSGNPLIDGLQFYRTNPTGSGGPLIDGNADFTAVNNIFKGHNNASFWMYGIDHNAAITSIIRNNLFYNFDSTNASSTLILANNASAVCTLQNNTGYSGYFGFRFVQGDCTATNNLTRGTGSGTGFNGAGFNSASDYNSAEDSSATTINLTQTAGSPWNSSGDTDDEFFIDVVGDDYHTYIGSIIDGVGANLFSTLITDYERDRRPDGAFALGADEPYIGLVSLTADAAIAWLDEVGAGVFDEETTLAAIAAIASVGEGEFEAAAALTAAALITIVGEADLEGVTSLSAIAQDLYLGGLDVAGDITLTADAAITLLDTVSKDETVTLASDTALALVGEQDHEGAVSLASTAFLSVDGILTLDEAATLLSDAGLASSAITTFEGAVTLTAASILAWVDELIESGVFNEEVTFTADSALVTTEVLEAVGALSLIADAQVTASAIMEAFGEATLASDAALATTGGTVFEDETTLASVTQLSTVVGILVSETVGLDSVAALATVGILDLDAIAALAADAGIAINSNLVAAVAVTLSGNAALDVAGIFETDEAVILSANAAQLQAAVFDHLESIILAADGALGAEGTIGIEVPAKFSFIVDALVRSFIVARNRTI